MKYTYKQDIVTIVGSKLINTGGNMMVLDLAIAGCDSLKSVTVTADGFAGYNKSYSELCELDIDIPTSGHCLWVADDDILRLEDMFVDMVVDNFWFHWFENFSQQFKNELEC